MAPIAAPASAPFSALFESPPTAAPKMPPSSAPPIAPFSVLERSGAFGWLAQPTATTSTRPLTAARSKGFMGSPPSFLDDEDHVAHLAARRRCTCRRDRLRLAGRIVQRAAQRHLQRLVHLHADLRQRQA